MVLRVSACMLEDRMKKLGIMVIALALFVAGMAMADPGINAVSETQGLSTSTTVVGVGNFNHASSVVITAIDGNDLGDVPAGLDQFRYYTTVYTEDTQNSENGYLSYDKDLDVNTGNMLLGQYNVQAVKQITYVGIDASSILTTDYMMLDGAGEDYGTGEERFIEKSSDAGVQLYNNVGVGSYATDVPSVGSVSAFIQGSIKEGGTGDAAGDLHETMTFKDSTAFSGQITSFAKAMAYKSQITG